MSSALTRALRVLAGCLGSSTSGRGAAASIKAVPPSAQISSHSRNSRVSRAAAAVFEPLEDRTLMSSTYYVSPSGNDSNSGTSTSAPWKSIGKVSGTHLNAGDHVLFQGGQTFSGSLNLYNDGSSSSNPVLIGSYGSGRATISSGGSNGAWALNSTGITFNNLKFVGSPQHNPSQNGIRIENYTSNTTRSGFIVTNCDISGYGVGIGFGSDSSSESLNNISITSNSIYNNVDAGIESWCVTTESNTNVYIADNQVYGNYGDGSSVCTGSGIMLQGLNGAVIERNEAYDNGAKGGNGGVGIWAYTSNNVTIQYNESYDNCTTRGEDGDGIDFDSAVTNSVIQYNYCFGNDGTGVQLDQWLTDGSFHNDIARYNVLQDNGRLNNYGNLEVWGNVVNSYLYDNVIFTTPGSSGSNSAIRVHNSTIPSLFVNGVHFVNNVIETTGGTMTINIPYAETVGMKNLTFTGNVYWASGGSLNIHDGNSTYTSLSSWQGAGQEIWSSKKVGLFADPKLASTGSAGVISNVNALASMSAYQLTSSSPSLSQGLNAASMYGLSTVSSDFFGHAVPTSSAATPGADQVVSGAVVAAGATSVPIGAVSITSTGTATAPTTGTVTVTAPTDRNGNRAENRHRHHRHSHDRNRDGIEPDRCYGRDRGRIFQFRIGYQLHGHRCWH